MNLEDAFNPCPAGCLFRRLDNGEYVLHGDCRVPWADGCYLNSLHKQKLETEEVPPIDEEQI